MIVLTALATPLQGQALRSVVQLPAPSGQPMENSAAQDPVLALANETVSAESFRAAIGAAVQASALVAESKAGISEADAARREAKAYQFPTIDLGVSGSQSIARKFSNDPNLIVERSRPIRRFDLTGNVQQTLFDFGAASRRIEAANARIVAAEADTTQTADRVALRAIGAWYDLFAYGQLVELGNSFRSSQQDVKAGIEWRIRQGVSAPVDRARVDAAIAATQLRNAQFGRALANAQARYQEIFKAPPEQPIGRPPQPVEGLQSRDFVIELARKSSVVRSAQAAAQALSADARAARADTLPTITAGIDAGRYGILETGREDYDVRARIAIRQRLFGPGRARADGASARASAALSRAIATEDEAVREASIAWSDVEMLRDALAAQQAHYLSARMTRDAVVERFRVSRGTLFDVLDAEDRFFEAAANYVRTLSEFDSAHYVLLARTGQLLESLKIEPVSQRPTR